MAKTLLITVLAFVATAAAEPLFLSNLNTIYGAGYPYAAASPYTASLQAYTNAVPATTFSVTSGNYLNSLFPGLSYPYGALPAVPAVSAAVVDASSPLIYNPAYTNPLFDLFYRR